MASPTRILPVEENSVRDRDDESFASRVSRSVDVALGVECKAPANNQRKGWFQRNPEDFGDGGAYPEVHAAQFPVGMGKPTTTEHPPMEKSQFDYSTSLNQKMDPVIDKPKDMSIVEPRKEIAKPKPSMQPVFAVKSKPPLPNLARSIIIPVPLPIKTKTSKRLANRRANSSSTAPDSPSPNLDSKRSRVEVRRAQIEKKLEQKEESNGKL